MDKLGLDYAYARPSGAQLKAAGVVGAGRYLSSDSRGITRAEYNDYAANGVGVWLAYEDQTKDLSVSMLNGYAKGVADAKNAVAHLAQLGLPTSTIVHWAADFDIAPGSAEEAQAESYVDGWNTVFPKGRRAGYGGLAFLKYLHEKGKVDRLWECASTSFRHGIDPSTVPLDLQQTTGAVPIADTDHNNIFTTASFVGASPEPTSEEDDMQLITIYLDVPMAGRPIGTSAADQKANPLAASTAVINPGTGWQQTSTGYGARDALNAQVAIANALGIAVVEKHVNYNGWIMAKSMYTLPKPASTTTATVSVDASAVAKQINSGIAAQVAAAVVSSVKTLIGKVTFQ